MLSNLVATIKFHMLLLIIVWILMATFSKFLIIVDSCIIWFHLDFIMQFQYWYYIATNVSSRKNATTFGYLPDWSYYEIKVFRTYISKGPIPDSKVHGDNMGATWVLSARWTLLSWIPRSHQWVTMRLHHRHTIWQEYEKCQYEPNGNL